MKLYHYTNDERILKEGILSYIKHDDTLLINELVKKYTDDIYDRDNCVFLSFDKRNEGDIIVSIDVNNLNKDYLYVANQLLANEIFSNFYKGKEDSVLIKNYINSIIPFEQYKGQYEYAELLYQDNIPAIYLKQEN